MMSKKSRLRFTHAACLFFAGLILLGAVPSRAADEPDLIFRRSTVFKLLSPDDKLATYGIDDPEVQGVACHFTVPEKGGYKGWLGLAEEVSDISLSSVTIAASQYGVSQRGGDESIQPTNSTCRPACSR